MLAPPPQGNPGSATGMDFFPIDKTIWWYLTKSVQNLSVEIVSLHLKVKRLRQLFVKGIKKSTVLKKGTYKYTFTPSKKELK